MRKQVQGRELQFLHGNQVAGPGLVKRDLKSHTFPRNMVALLKESVVAGVADIPALITITDNPTIPMITDSSPYCYYWYQSCYKSINLVSSLKFYCDKNTTSDLFS